MEKLGSTYSYGNNESRSGDTILITPGDVACWKSIIASSTDNFTEKKTGPKGSRGTGETD